MQHNRILERFEEPVKEMEELLGSPFTKEHTALSILCGLIQTYQPKKVVKMGRANDNNLLVVLKCIQMLQLNCQVYVVDSTDEKSYFSLAVRYDLKKKKQQCNMEMNNCKILYGHTLAAWADVIGNDIDLLLLDAVDNMPNDLLSFIAAFPFLNQSAVVVLYDAVFTCKNTQFLTNVLFRNICSEKLLCAPECDLDIWNKIPSISQYTIAAFVVNANTAAYMKDLFMLLKSPWSHTPRLLHMMEYVDLITEHYDSKCLELYHQILFDKASHWGVLEDLTQSIFSTFRQILLYGKGERGQCFLKVAKILGIDIAGFVVSDGRSRTVPLCGLPVYTYSKIPFAKEDVLIIQTTNSKEIEKRLKHSGYHWLKLPENLWEES